MKIHFQWLPFYGWALPEVCIKIVLEDKFILVQNFLHTIFIVFFPVFVEDPLYSWIFIFGIQINLPFHSTFHEPCETLRLY